MHMWPFRRKRPPPTSRPEFPELQPPPEVGDAEYQAPRIPTPIATGLLFRGDEHLGTWKPTGVRQPPDAPPEPIRKDEPMTDENPDNVSAGPYGGDNPNESGPADPRPIDLAEADTYAGRRVAPEDTNARLERDARPKIERPDCPHCRGTGKVLTKNDQLRASLDLLGVDPTVHNDFAAEFYRRVFTAADWLRVIFPPDLAEPASDPNGRGKGQRDKLVAAIFALGQTYDPGNAEAMQVLDQNLAWFGRSHSAFEFPDGVRPPTLEEYRLVKVILFGLMIEVCADKWLDEYTAVWSEAYDYAYRKMGDAAWKWLQENDGNVHPRSVRQ